MPYFELHYDRISIQYIKDHWHIETYIETYIQKSEFWI